MTAKRKTKAEKLDEERSTLWWTIYHVFCGACGRTFDEAEDGEASEWLSLDEASRAVSALRDLFASQENCNWCFSLQNLSRFDSVRAARDFLWEAGIRP